MGVKKADTIPAELVARYIEDWVARHDGDSYHGYRTLSMRSGLNDSVFWKLCNGSYGANVRFDVVDRIFCALEIPNIWYCDDKLSAVYEDKVAEADRLHPLEGYATAA